MYEIRCASCTYGWHCKVNIYACQTRRRLCINFITGSGCISTRNTAYHCQTQTHCPKWLIIGGMHRPDISNHVHVPEFIP
jgi:hypothetical protein